MMEISDLPSGRSQSVFGCQQVYIRLIVVGWGRSLAQHQVDNQVDIAHIHLVVAGDVGHPWILVSGVLAQ